jgi:hypothetical protein
MDPEEQPMQEELEDEPESSDAESDEAGRDTDISVSWGALPATTQQVSSTIRPQVCIFGNIILKFRYGSCPTKFITGCG